MWGPCSMPQRLRCRAAAGAWCVGNGSWSAQICSLRLSLLVKAGHLPGEKKAATEVVAASMGRESGLLGGSQRLIDPAVEGLLVGLDPAVGVALDVGGLVLALAHHVV